MAAVDPGRWPAAGKRGPGDCGRRPVGRRRGWRGRIVGRLQRSGVVATVRRERQCGEVSPFSELSPILLVPSYREGLDMTRKWILILSCVLVGFGSTVALRISMSNDRRLNAALADLADKADEESAPRNKPRTPARAAVPASKPASLRQRFVELASERAKRMNDEELSQAVAEITQSLADQDAAAETELQTAAEQLKAVAEKFPGTPAGERANRA